MTTPAYRALRSYSAKGDSPQGYPLIWVATRKHINDIERAECNHIAFVQPARMLHSSMRRKAIKCVLWCVEADVAGSQGSDQPCVQFYKGLALFQERNLHLFARAKMGIPLGHCLKRFHLPNDLFNDGDKFRRAPVHSEDIGQRDMQRPFGARVCRAIGNAVDELHNSVFLRECHTTTVGILF